MKMSNIERLREFLKQAQEKKLTEPMQPTVINQTTNLFHRKVGLR
jgi:hypothetical protein